MIVDKIENYKLYTDINSRFSKAFKFLIETDLDSLDTGKHVIEGEELFVFVNEYVTKPNPSKTLEGHKRYIDLQYISKGFEIIDFETINKQLITKEYNSIDDYALYKGENINGIKLNKGMFSILFPDDLHLPGILDTKDSFVKKIVVKILID